MLYSKPLRIAKILSDSEIVLNAGRDENIKIGNEFIIYGIGSEEIFDPQTHKSLGYLELYRGIGYVTKVQDKLSVLHALKLSTTYHRSLAMLGNFDNAKFDSPAVGDYAKPNATKVR